MGHVAHGDVEQAESPKALQKALPKSSSLHAGQFDGSPEHIGVVDPLSEAVAATVCHTVPVVFRRGRDSGTAVGRADDAVLLSGSGDVRRIW